MPGRSGSTTMSPGSTSDGKGALPHGCNGPRQALHRRGMGRAVEHGHHRGDLAAHGRGHRDRSRGVERRRRPRRRRRAPRVRLRSVAADEPRRARRHDGEDLAAPAGALRGCRPHDQRGDGLADLLLDHGPDVRVHDGARLLHEPRARVRVRRLPGRRARAGARAARTGRRRRLHRAVERPAVHDHVEDGARAGVRFHRRAEARAGDPARRVPPRRRDRRGRAARGCGQHRGRGPRRRRAPRHAPRRRQDQLHRFHRGREAHRRALRRAAQALHPRARGQVGGDHPRRRRSRHRDPRTAAELDHEQRPGVHRADPHPRVTARATTTSSTRSRRRCRRPRSARRSTPRPSWGRWSRRVSATGSRASSPRVGRKARASSWAAAVPPSSRPDGSSSRPCSPTSTTR